MSLAALLLFFALTSMPCQADLESFEESIDDDESDETTTTAPECPTGFTQQTNGRCYFVQAATAAVRDLSWAQAEAACQAMDSNAHLVALETAAEYFLMLYVLQSSGFASPRGVNFWTGANRDPVTGVSTWVGTNPPAPYNLRAQTSEQQDLSAVSACGRIRYTTGGNYRHRRFRCVFDDPAEMGYICEVMT